MGSINKIEESFIKAFIIPEKQARYLEMLGSKNRRKEILDRFNHELDYNASFARKVSPKEQVAQSIERLLRNEGAPDICHIISSNPDLDGNDISLSEALKRVIGSGNGSALCCIPGRLAYYESEDMGERYILVR